MTNVSRVVKLDVVSLPLLRKTHASQNRRPQLHCHVLFSHDSTGIMLAATLMKQIVSRVDTVARSLPNLYSRPTPEPDGFSPPAPGGQQKNRCVLTIRLGWRVYVGLFSEKFGVIAMFWYIVGRLVHKTVRKTGLHILY